MKRYYKIENLYDVDGNKYDHFDSNPNEADMCELVRSLAYSGMIRTNP